ncbi:MAG: sulfite exporter TauE/SafE family protein [Candidatus Kariarchaeaceae archaeon]
MTTIILIVSGFFFGLLSPAVGIGGGLMNVPFLDYVMKLETNEATFVSSFVIIFSSSSGALKYRSEKRIDYRTAFQFLVLAIPGVIIGGWFADRIPRKQLRQIFGIVVSLAGIRGIRKAYLLGKNNINPDELNSNLPQTGGVEHRKIIDNDGVLHEYYVKIGIGRIFAFFGGLIGGLLGLGGGIVYMPVLTAISGVPIHIAAATSTSMIVVVSIIAIITRIISQIEDGTLDTNLLWEYGIPLAIGSVIGARVGAGRVKKLDSKKLLALFWSIAFIAGIRMLINPLIT